MYVPSVRLGRVRIIYCFILGHKSGGHAAVVVYDLLGSKVLLFRTGPTNGCGATEFFVIRLQTIITIVIPNIIHWGDSNRFQQVDNFHRSNIKTNY